MLVGTERDKIEHCLLVSDPSLSHIVSIIKYLDTSLFSSTCFSLTMHAHIVHTTSQLSATGFLHQTKSCMVHNMSS